MSETYPMPHQLIINDRKQLTVSGISDVDSFDDTAVIASTPLGDLTIRGRGLQICRFSIDSGELAMDGTIDSVEYTSHAPSKKGVFAKLFK